MFVIIPCYFNGEKFPFFDGFGKSLPIFHSARVVVNSPLKDYILTGKPFPEENPFLIGKLSQLWNIALLRKLSKVVNVSQSGIFSQIVKISQLGNLSQSGNHSELGHFSVGKPYPAGNQFPLPIYGSILQRREFSPNCVPVLSVKSLLLSP